MKHRRQNIKAINLPDIAWLSLVILSFLISTAIGFRAIPQSWAVTPVMEIYQQKDGTSFGVATSLDIFNDPKFNGQKLIAPYAKGSYDFAVYNNSSKETLPYTIDIKTHNPNNIPLVISLQKIIPSGSVYVFGGSTFDEKQALTQFHMPEVLLNGGQTDNYTLSWEWKTQSDELDTAFGINGTQFYKLTIMATGTQGDGSSGNGGGSSNSSNSDDSKPIPSLDSGPVQLADDKSQLPSVDSVEVNPVKGGDSKVTGVGVPGASIIIQLPDGTQIGSGTVGEDGTWLIDVNISLKEGDTIIITQIELGKEPSDPISVIVGLGNSLVQPSLEDGSNLEDEINLGDGINLERPQTGDSTNMGLWISVLLISTLVLLIIVFSRRKKNSNESNKLNH